MSTAFTPQTLSLISPCKINLFLHITGKREDGYHLLQTAFQLLNFGDTMHFETRDDGSIVLEDNTGIPPNENLIYQAAKALKPYTKQNQGIHITLDKQLPTGGGVGGGSSNAATTLLALNTLWKLQLDEEKLAEIGLALGADVPVFVRGKSAWAEGVGEALTPITLPERWFVVVKPKVFVSTGEIFSSEPLTRDTEMRTIAAFLEELGTSNRLKGHFKNDCEPVVRARYPQIDNALNTLSSLAHQLGSKNKACLTGTGACIFLQCTDQKNAQTLVEQLPTDWEFFVAQGINHSPVHAALDKQC